MFAQSSNNTNNGTATASDILNVNTFPVMAGLPTNMATNQNGKRLSLNNNGTGMVNQPIINSHQQHLHSSFGAFIFDPHVQAQCERNLMHITIQFDQPFNGIVHVRNFRRNPCQTYGNGSLITTLTIDLLAHSNRANFCGVHRIKVNI